MRQLVSIGDIADNLSKARWSWGCITSLDSQGRDIVVVDAHRDGKRVVVRADEKLTAFVELESEIHACGPIVLSAIRQQLQFIVYFRSFHCQAGVDT